MDTDPEDNNGTTTHETVEEFYAAAVAKFGEDKFTCLPVIVSTETEAVLTVQGWTPKMIEELKQYKQVWIKPHVKKYGDFDIVECPACGTDLTGFFGVFEWGIINGYGTCGHCHQIDIKLIHRFEDEKALGHFEAMALSAF